VVDVKMQFDVHGANEPEITAAAWFEIAAFSATPVDEVRLEWNVDIEVYQEAVSAQGMTALWRGEVTARRE
jgi:hypothetical protein